MAQLEQTTTTTNNKPRNFNLKVNTSIFQTYASYTSWIWYFQKESFKVSYNLQKSLPLNGLNNSTDLSPPFQLPHTSFLY